MGAVLERVQDIAKTLVADRAADVDQLVLWPEQGIRALQQAGLAGMAIPREFGGLGHGSFAVAQTCEIPGQECAPTAMCFGMHLVGSAVLSAKATSDQQVSYVQPIIEGRHLTTLSLTESGTGSQFYIPRTRLDAISPNLYRVNGTKTFVTNGGRADSYVISTVAADPDALPAAFTAKAEVADCAVTIVNEVMTSCGGIGYRGGSRLYRLLRDARAAHVMAPTTDVLRLWTGRALLGN